MNPNGGQTTNDGLQTTLKSGAYQIVRNGEAQIYNDSYYPTSLQILLFVENTLVSPSEDTTGWPSNTCVNNNCFTVDTGVNQDSWTVVSSQEEEVVAGTTWRAVEVLSVIINSRTYTLTVTSTYTKPNAFVDVRYSLQVPAGSTGPVMLYHVSDFYLDGSDDGPGVTQFVNGKRLVAQAQSTGNAVTAVGGIIEGPEGPGFTSWYEEHYECVFGDCATVPFSGGPWNGTGYPNTVNPDPETDAGVGAHWNLGSNLAGQTVVRTSQLFFSAQLPPADAPGGAANHHCRFFGNCRN